jgi:hypothetical protein
MLFSPRTVAEVAPKHPVNKPSIRQAKRKHATHLAPAGVAAAVDAGAVVAVQQLRPWGEQCLVRAAEEALWNVLSAGIPTTKQNPTARGTWRWRRLLALALLLFHTVGRPLPLHYKTQIVCDENKNKHAFIPPPGPPTELLLLQMAVRGEQKRCSGLMCSCCSTGTGDAECRRRRTVHVFAKLHRRPTQTAL